MKENRPFQISVFLILTILLYGTASSCKAIDPIEQEKLHFLFSIPTEGNSWVIGDLDKNEELIKEGGIKNWNNEETVIRTYFKVEQTGQLNLGILARSVSGYSVIKLKCGDKTAEIKVANNYKDTISAGIFEIKEKGYQFVEIQGLQKTGAYFPEIESILIGGEATAGKVYFAKDDFYWGRRGPSVHLNFQAPENAEDILYFYNEITVPEDNNVLGSYFMANGFAQGYFGIQVNSPTERRVLFSVWSPYKTDNPDEIPEEFKIKLQKKGEDVYTGEFGNEGSGGQSYFKFMWKAETTYRFLLKGEPTGNGETDFTAWFFAPEIGNWKLIASFRRPKTNSYLTRLHSFLENFYTETGNVTRKGIYTNQWIYNSEKKWIEITKMKFTADATARKESRMDYSGGVENQAFYLKNCGFFKETTTFGSNFERLPNGNPPSIDFEELP